MDLLLDYRLTQARLLPQGKGDVVIDRERIKQRPALEQHAEAVAHAVERSAAQSAEFDAIDPDLSVIRP